MNSIQRLYPSTQLRNVNSRVRRNAKIVPLIRLSGKSKDKSVFGPVREIPLLKLYTLWYDEFSFARKAICNFCVTAGLYRFARGNTLIFMDPQPATLAAAKRRPAPSLDATLVTSVPLSSNAQHLIFQVNGGVTGEARLDFLPGQSIRIEIPLNGRPTPFAYSIASPPSEDNRFELCLKGVSKGSPADSLRELKEGTQVRVTHPQGNFVLQHPVGDTIFLAAGTGIAPIRSMVHWLMRSGHHHQN